MPFSTHLRNSCFYPADSSILSSVPPRSSSSIKSLLCRRFFKRRSSRKGSTIVVQEVNPNNYDMTILHDDELNNTVHRRKKTIPSWAKQDQLQLAIINQIYFQKKTPEDIFGNVCMEDAFIMIDSLDIKNKESISMIVSRHFI